MDKHGDYKFPMENIGQGDKLVVTLKVPLNIPSLSEKAESVTEQENGKGFNERTESLVAKVEGTTNLACRYELKNTTQHVGHNIWSTAKYVNRETDHKIANITLNKDLLFILTESGIMNCLRMDRNNQAPYKLLWRKQLPRKLFNITPSGTGFSFRIPGDGTSMYTYDSEGNSSLSKTEAFQPLIEKFSPKIWIVKSQRTEDGSAILTHAYLNGRFVLILGKTDSDILQIFEIPPKAEKDTNIFFGMNNVFCVSYDMQNTEVRVLSNLEGEVSSLEVIADLPNNSSRNTDPSITFDRKLNIGMLCTGGNIYQILKSGDKFLLKDSEKWPLKLHVYTVAALGEGRFAAIAISGLMDAVTITPDRFPELNLIEFTFNAKTNTFDSKFNKTSRTIFTEPHRCIVHGPVAVGNDHYCFTTGTQFFVYRFGRQEAIHYELTMSTSVSMNQVEDTIVLALLSSGDIFSLNVH
jgi:hypothetical protein